MSIIAGIASALGGAASSFLGGAASGAGASLGSSLVNDDPSGIPAKQAEGLKSTMAGETQPAPEVAPSISGRQAAQMLGKSLGTTMTSLAKGAGEQYVGQQVQKLLSSGVKSASEQGSDTRAYLDAAFPNLNQWEQAGSGGSMSGSASSGQDVQLKSLQTQKDIAKQNNETAIKVAGIQSATAIENTKQQVYAQNEMLDTNKNESYARINNILQSSATSHQDMLLKVQQTLNEAVRRGILEATPAQVKAATQKLVSGAALDRERATNERYAPGSLSKEVKGVLEQLNWSIGGLTGDPSGNKSIYDNSRGLAIP